MALAVSCARGWVRMNALDELGYRSRQGSVLGTNSPGRPGVIEADKSCAGASSFLAAWATAAFLYAPGCGGGTGG